MSRAVVNLGLLALLALLVVLHLVLGIDPEVPNVELFPDMAHSQRADAFSASTVFDDGMTLRTPPEGTIPRGFAPLGFGPSAEEAARAGVELQSPVDASSDPEAVRGAHVYTTFCQPCHGAGGAGDGPVTRRGVPPPLSLLAENARSAPDGRLFHVVSFGQGNMPGYAPQISREDRWHAVLYIRWLQRQESPRNDAVTSSPAGA